MTDVSAAQEFLDAVIAAFAVLGGLMAYHSGLYAAREQAAHGGPGAVSEAINEGVADGFVTGVPFAMVALIIAVWS